jgi:hypothetical protein
MEMGGIGATARRGPSRTVILAVVGVVALTACLIGLLFAFFAHG